MSRFHSLFKVRPARTVLAAATAATIVAMSLAVPAHASSHREAPFITSAPKVDGTDFYMLRSYETGRSDYVTLIANYVPLQDAYGGPNYFSLDPNAMYEIHIDNNGDAREDLTFQFRFKNTLKNAALTVGGKSVAIPLVHGVGMTSVGSSALINVQETFTVDVMRGDRRKGNRTSVTSKDGAVTFTKPLDFIGHKTFGSDQAYQSYANQYVHDIKIPGCELPGRMFVGQRKDPFVVALGKAFDQFNLNPLGASVNGNADDLADKNVTAIEMEVPIACLTTATEPVIGGWTTASLRQSRLLDGSPAAGNSNVERVGGAWTQVSRLGMPLVNELVIGLKDKDRFNASKPKDDGQFADYVTHPTVPTILNALFGVSAPSNYPRNDLVATFLTGLSGIDQPKNVVGSEMLRLNTKTPATTAAAQSNLGVLGGDSAGFPNGRRPGDDVVDATLRVANGILCTLNAPAVFGCVPADALSGSAALTDGANVDASFFNNTFPYLKTPLAGARSN